MGRGGRRNSPIEIVRERDSNSGGKGASNKDTESQVTVDILAGESEPSAVITDVGDC